jgi:hypothetical protein
MPTFLVESYTPEPGLDAARVAAVRLDAGFGVRHRCSLVLPDEDLCLHVLEGASADAVHEATERAAVRCQRLSEVVLLIAAEDLNAKGDSP